MLLTAMMAFATACGSGDDGGGGGGGGGGDDWDTTIEALVDTLCVDGAACTGDDPGQCEGDVRTDMADARAQLDAAGEARCLACLDVKMRELRKIIAASCDVAAADTDAIYAACDLDPATDYNGDDDPANDDDEACAGFP